MKSSSQRELRFALNLLNLRNLLTSALALKDDHIILRNT